MRVILAPRRAAAIALRNPEAFVVDYQGQCIRRGADRIVLGSERNPTQLFRVCVSLCCSFGRGITRAELLDVLFGEDPNGGPLYCEGILSKLLFQAKPFLSWAGLRLVRAYDGRVDLRSAEVIAHPQGRSFRISNHGVWPVGVAA